MEFIEIGKDDYAIFHDLLFAYYREGEDADTPEEVMDAFIRALFDEVIRGSVHGCFVREGSAFVGFALWALDTADFAYSEMPGLGTISEIGIAPAYRASGRGGRLLAHVEEALREIGAEQCYVSAYGPAQTFWNRCGYREIGKTASNGLPILVKSIK